MKSRPNVQGSKTSHRNRGAKTCSILVVDDEKRIADTLALILSTKGYTAKAAYDGSSGIEICRKFRPDLVISDVVMPGMNGIEMAIEIRRKFAGCQILLFSGQAASADMLESARTRGHDFEMLAKPIHPEQLLDKVSQVLGPQSCGPDAG